MSETSDARRGRIQRSMVALSERSARCIGPVRLGVGVLVLAALFGALAAGGPSGLSAQAPKAWPGAARLDLLLIGLWLTGLFIACKAVALRACGAASGVAITTFGAARLFCEGVAVELVTWPGKVFADAYRAVSLPGGDAAARMSAVILWRISSITGGACVLLVAAGWLSQQPAGLLWGAVALLLAGALGVVALRTLLRDRPQFSAWLTGSVVASLAASVLDVLLITMIVRALAGVPAELFAPRYVLLAAIAAGSTLPLGLGVLDGACVLVLTAEFGVPADVAIACMLAYRLLGPTVTLLLGSGGLLMRRSVRPIAPAPTEVSARV